MLNALVGLKLVTVVPSSTSIGCLVVSWCKWLVDSSCTAEAEVRLAIAQLDCRQATGKKFAEAKVADPKLVVVAGLWSVKLRLFGAEAAAGKDPDSTSKLVQDPPF